MKEEAAKIPSITMVSLSDTTHYSRFSFLLGPSVASSHLAFGCCPAPQDLFRLLVSPCSRHHCAEEKALSDNSDVLLKIGSFNSDTDRVHQEHEGRKQDDVSTSQGILNMASALQKSGKRTRAHSYQEFTLLTP